MRKLWLAGLVICGLGFLQTGYAAEKTLGTEDVPRMAKEQLKTMLGSSDLIIVDVRKAEDWDEASVKIKGAVREDAHNLGAWIDKYPKDKTLVFYCA